MSRDGPQAPKQARPESPQNIYIVIGYDAADTRENIRASCDSIEEEKKGDFFPWGRGFDILWDPRLSKPKDRALCES